MGPFLLGMLQKRVVSKAQLPIKRNQLTRDDAVDLKLAIDIGSLLVGVGGTVN